MANILTLDEASRVVKVDPIEEELELADILPQVDAIIQEATGWDWANDNPINPVAKHAARCRLAIDYDLGAMNPSQSATLERAYTSAIIKLEALVIGLQAIQNINSTSYVEDMKVYLESEALGLNMIDYNRLSHANKYDVAQSILNNRPSGGYTNKEAIQEALDTSVKVVMP